VTTDQSGLGDTLILGTLAFALILTVISAATTPGIKLSGSMGPARWDPRESWASTLTALGAVLGIVLSASVLMPKEAPATLARHLTALSVLFGVLTVVAPFVYNATRRRVSSAAGVGEPQHHGYVWSFLLASCTVLWAVSGQLATLFFLVRELHMRGSISGLISGIFQIVVVVSFIALTPYATRSIRIALETGNPQSAVREWVPRPWTLL
jgi:hypothetical protein